MSVNYKRDNNELEIGMPGKNVCPKAICICIIMGWIMSVSTSIWKFIVYGNGDFERMKDDNNNKEGYATKLKQLILNLEQTIG
jgi:hypothetical protein